MNMLKKFGEDLKEYFKPERVKERLEREIDMEELRIKRDKIKMERDKLTKERLDNQPRPFRIGVEK